jgi:hypothetical protein
MMYIFGGGCNDNNRYQRKGRMISDTYHKKNNTYRFAKAALALALSLVLLLMITGTWGDVVAFFHPELIPFVSFDIISYGAGLTKMSLRNFTLATFLGMLPLTFVYNYFGAILISGRFLPLILGVMVIFLFFLLPRWIERYNPFSLRQFFQHGEQSTREK